MASSQVDRNAGIVLVALGVILYVVFGLVLGTPTDVGPYSLLIVPLVIGLGLLWRSTAPDADER